MGVLSAAVTLTSAQTNHIQELLATKDAKQVESLLYTICATDSRTQRQKAISEINSLYSQLWYRQREELLEHDITIWCGVDRRIQSTS